jgi:SHS2 domain-containing protein
MSYRYLEHAATADVAFEARAGTLQELFVSAADATMNVMIENIESIRPLQIVRIELRDREADMLLFDLLQELIYYKDAEQLLLRVSLPVITSEPNGLLLESTAMGEKLDPERHRQRVDVKAVTLHRFTVEQVRDGRWRAIVILDV